MRPVTFAETMDGTITWTVVQRVTGHSWEHPNGPFMVACGFGFVPTVIEHASLLVDQAGNTSWFPTMDAARRAAVEVLRRRIHEHPPASQSA